MALINISQPEPRAWRALLTLARGSAFTVVEVLAALALDGWISTALWVMAAWNTVSLLLLVVGMAMVTEKHVRQDEGATR